jgi:hypothetical protein
MIASQVRVLGGRLVDMRLEKNNVALERRIARRAVDCGERRGSFLLPEHPPLVLGQRFGKALGHGTGVVWARIESLNVWRRVLSA